MAAAAISLSPSRQGEAFVDAQTPLSFIVGFVAGVLGVDPSIAAIVFVGAKIVDQSISRTPEAALFRRDRGESLGNQLTDVVVNFAGVQLGAKVRDRVLAAPATAAPAAIPAAGLGFALHPLLNVRQ